MQVNISLYVAMPLFLRSIWEYLPGAATVTYIVVS